MSQSSSPFSAYPILIEMRNTVEADLQASIRAVYQDNYAELRSMLEYHMGWMDGINKGKRIRPLLLLLVAQSAGGDWKKCIAAASTIELIHNFTLIHDDIEDGSDYRHGRLAVWKKHGTAQAINAGDSLYTLAMGKLWELERQFSTELVARCFKVLNQTCLRLTEGQYLDMAFEGRQVVTTQQYLEMIGGKTTALLSACAQIGAILAGVDEMLERRCVNYGYNLGMAFQLIDDYLGVWGDPNVTGKSAATDLISKKKSYPVLYGLDKSQSFADYYQNEQFTQQTALVAAQMLDKTGAKTDTLRLAEEYTANAIIEAGFICQAAEQPTVLTDLTSWLLKRAA